MMVGRAQPLGRGTVIVSGMDISRSGEMERRAIRASGGGRRIGGVGLPGIGQRGIGRAGRTSGLPRVSEARGT